MEVWLQEYQVDRENSSGRRPADHYLDEGGSARVRFLLQRQPERRTSALEPSVRAPHRRRITPDTTDEQTKDARLQRLCRASGAALRRHGFAQVLLNRDDARAYRRRCEADRVRRGAGSTNVSRV